MRSAQNSFSIGWSLRLTASMESQWWTCPYGGNFSIIWHLLGYCPISSVVCSCICFYYMLFLCFKSQLVVKNFRISEVLVSFVWLTLGMGIGVFFSYWISSFSGIGPHTLLTMDNPTASTSEWTLWLLWPCLRSEYTALGSIWRGGGKGKR